MAYHKYHCFHVNVVYMFMLSALKFTYRICGAIISAMLLILLLLFGWLMLRYIWMADPRIYLDG